MLCQREGEEGGNETPCKQFSLFSLELAVLWKDFLMFKVLAASLRKGPAAFSSAAGNNGAGAPCDSVEA